MLQANKTRVVAELACETLEIRHLELRYWIDVFKKFGVLAAFLGGFASSVSLIHTRGQDTKGANLLFVLAAGGATGFNLVLLVVSVLCSLFGPGKALTGRGDESYNVAIGIMERMYRHCLVLFRLGLLCYLAASIFAVFSMFAFLSAAMVSGVFLSFAYLLALRSAQLRAKFVPQTFSSGSLKGNPVRDIGAELTGREDPGLAGFVFDTSFGKRI
ncbi:UNVERIFIED_CONTAM: hypothetical protein HHA_240730 [Hammondia hammondi]|eukprot:XP_008887834.1 hypothetical protein HHA_240730 [Hammondia hammondi]